MKKTMFPVFLIIISLLFNVTAFSQSAKSVKTPSKLPGNSVTFSGLQAQNNGKGTLVKWQTSREVKNIGFLVYRVTAEGRELASRSLIPGVFLRTSEADSTGGTYSFFDEKGTSDTQYVIESINDASQKQSSDAVSTETGASFNSQDAQTAEVAANSNAASSVESNTLNFAKQTTGASLTDLNVHRQIVAMAGVKIGVKKEGFFRVSRAELQTAGFNLTGSPANWQLYLDGIQQSIIVDASGNYLEFYGKTVNTVEADTRYYYLVAGTSPGKRINTNVLRRLNSVVASNSFYQTFEREERVSYAGSILNGDLTNFFGAVASSSSTIPNTDSFTLNGVDLNSATNAVFEINLQGVTTTSQSIQLQINNNTLPSVTGYGYQLMTGRFTIPASYLKEGTNVLKLSAAEGTSFVESIRISFNRKYAAVQNKLLFTTQNYKAASLDGFTSPNIRIFDLSNPDNPLLATNLNIVQNGSTYSVNLPSDRGKTLYAVENSGLLTADSVAANNPSTLSTTAHNANLVIISYKDFMTQANNWAAYRRAQGYSVEVINVEDIFDEFNFGVLSANSIRSFLQYAQGNWQTPPQYALLIGDAAYDSRNFAGNPLGSFNLVPTKLVDTIYTETGSDEALADFNDDGLAELAIGRIPARTAQQVTDALTKVQKFESTVAQAQSRGALFVSDQPDGYDFQAVNVRLSQQLPPGMPVTFINRLDANAPTSLLSQISTGKFLVHYSGHGNAGVWATASFFQTSDISKLTNSNDLSVFTMLTCLNGYFIQPTDSLSEVLLKSTNGGAVSVWSSTGLTTPDIQEVMGNRFYSDITAGTITRLGDLIKDAKTTIPGGRDVRLSWCLLGDPLLKMK